MTKNIINKRLIGSLILLAVTFVMGALAGCGGDTTASAPDAKEMTTGAAGAAGSTNQGTAGTAGTGAVAGNNGSSGSAGAVNTGVAGQNQVDATAGSGGSSDGGTGTDVGDVGSSAGSDGGDVAGKDGGQEAPAAGDPACQGKADFDPCTSTAYVSNSTYNNGVSNKMDAIHFRAINLQGKCYRGLCCSGCITPDGACSPVSDQGEVVTTPQSQVNNCGVNAALCFNCNSRDNMRACTYTVLHASATDPWTLGDGTCR